MHAIEIWTPTECTNCQRDLPKGADALKDPNTEDVYCLDCGSDIEDYDYDQYQRANWIWT